MWRKIGRCLLAMLDGMAHLVPEYYVHAKLYEIDQAEAIHDAQRELDRTAG